jgi:maleamate amidohydrolase
MLVPHHGRYSYSAINDRVAVAVAEDACFDRALASHAISLCDMYARYAEVIATAEILDLLNTLPDPGFNLPKGA